MTNNNPPQMPERIWANSAGNTYHLRDRIQRNTSLGNRTEYIRADLATPQPARLTVDEVEWVRHQCMEELGCFDDGENSPTPQWDKGYNEGALDMFNHLRERGVI
jgi:hypothetical protein